MHRISLIHLKVWDVCVTPTRTTEAGGGLASCFPTYAANRYEGHSLSPRVFSIRSCSASSLVIRLRPSRNSFSFCRTNRHMRWSHCCSRYTKSREARGTDGEVKLLRLLLVGSPLGQAGFAQIWFAEGGLDRLHAVAVVKALGDVKVLHGHHVLDGGQSGLHCFFHLLGREGGKTGCETKQAVAEGLSLKNAQLTRQNTDLLVLDLQSGEPRLQLLTPLVQLNIQRLLCTHHPHLQKHVQSTWTRRNAGIAGTPFRQKPKQEVYRVSHVGLEIKASWWTENVIVGLHHFLFVPVGLQTLSCSFQSLQARVFGRLHILLCR